MTGGSLFPLFFRCKGTCSSASLSSSIKSSTTINRFSRNSNWAVSNKSGFLFIDIKEYSNGLGLDRECLQSEGTGWGSMVGVSKEEWSDKRVRRREYLRVNKAMIQDCQWRYRLENREAILHQQRRYRLFNRAAILNRDREYRLLNREALQERRRRYLTQTDDLSDQRRQYYLSNKSSIDASKKKYRLLHREAINERQRQYYHRTSPPRKKKKWTTKEDVRAFFDSVRNDLHVSAPADWYRISTKQLLNVGGKGLYNSFCLSDALKFAYPEIDWDLPRFSARGRKTAQRWLRVMLERILPEDVEILEDFLHPDLLWNANAQFRMEIDIWIPKYNLALEYQGEQHYYELHGAYGGTLPLYTQRDLKKRIACTERGITLLSIPYWWDGRQESLASTLYCKLPEVFTPIDATPIPTAPPEPTKEESEDNRIAELLMKEMEWDGEDPTGWFMSERQDGVRAFWDGLRMYSRRGKVLELPLEFVHLLPRGVPLDGVLGRQHNTLNQQPFVKQTLTNNTSSWKDIQFYIFDAPMYPGHYLDRHTYASGQLNDGCGPCIFVVPIERCMGLEHLQAVLLRTASNRTAGVMLHHPESTYTAGKTSGLRKVKLDWL